MPARKRFKTDKPGVFYVEGKNRVTGIPTKCFYIRYCPPDSGTEIEEKAGYVHEGMTAYKASVIRAKKISGDLPSNSKRRAMRRAEMDAEANRYPINRLWAEYKANKRTFKGIATDESRFTKFLAPAFGNKLPNEIDSLSVERLKKKMARKDLSPQTIKNTLELLRRIVNYGVDHNLSERLSFKISFPKCNNIKTEDLNEEQLSRLLKVIEKDKHPIAGPMMLCALFTGMRRGEMFQLKWTDLDFEKRFISIRDPKGGIDQIIPMNEKVYEVFSKLARDSKYVFPGQDGDKRVDIKKPATRIKKEAGLPDEFRPFHGLRHVYASMLASSGEVDMYTIQKLMTHKSSEMTQRYAHLRDEALSNAGNMITNIMNEIENKNKLIRRKNRQ